MKVTIEKNELVIRIPMQEPAPSASGKTLVIATTRGNQKTDVQLKGYGAITVGVNAYVKSPQQKE